MQDYLKNKTKNKIEFSIDRNLSKKLPPIDREKSILDRVEDFQLDTLKITESIAIQEQKENYAYLDELFQRAFAITSKYLVEQNGKPDAENSVGANVSIDLYSGGTNNARIAYAQSLKKNDAQAKSKAPVVVDGYVGNIAILNLKDEDEIKFANQFQLMLEYGLKYFGKRFNELSKEDKTAPNYAGFTIVEKQQFPAITFAEKSFTSDQIITKLFEYSLKTFDPNVLNKKIKELCITFPSDFDTGQRTELRQCLDRLSIKKCNLITKPIAIAAPILLDNPDEKQKTLVIDFSSGYLSNTIMTIKSGKTITIKDRIVKKKISSEALMKKLIATVNLELQKQGSQLRNTYIVRNELEKALNKYGESLDGENGLPAKIEVEIDGKLIELDITKFGSEAMSHEIEECLRTSKFDLPYDEKFRLILNANPIIANSLIPKLKSIYPNAELILKTNEYAAVLGAAALVQQAKFGIETCDLLPYSVGISLYNGIIMTLIDGKTNYPCSGNHVFQTVSDNQKTIRVLAYEGDRSLSRNCKPIAEFVVRNLPQSLAGQIKCQITLKFDHNGVITPMARDIESKKELNIEMNTTSQISNIKKSGDGLVLDASADSEADKKLHQALDSLDLFMEYLMYISKEIPKANKDDVALKISRAKNYINAHKNDISIEDCDQLKLELEECADNNNLQRRKSIAVPASQVFNKQQDSKTCVIS